MFSFFSGIRRQRALFDAKEREVADDPNKACMSESEGGSEEWRWMDVLSRPYNGVLQCGGVCCSVCCHAYSCCVLQRVATCCSVLQMCCHAHITVCCSLLQYFEVCRSAQQCAAVCCSALQCAAVCCRCAVMSTPQRFAACCSTSQRVAACCSVLQRVAGVLSRPHHDTSDRTRPSLWHVESGSNELYLCAQTQSVP